MRIKQYKRNYYRRIQELQTKKEKKAKKKKKTRGHRKQYGDCQREGGLQGGREDKGGDK